jgi:hypothetical protein
MIHRFVLYSIPLVYRNKASLQLWKNKPSNILSKTLQGFRLPNAKGQLLVVTKTITGFRIKKTQSVNGIP